MRFRWGIIGAGSIAGKMVDALRRTEGCELAAIASRDQSRADAFALKYGIPAAYGSYEAMLAAEKLDAVYIAARTDSHAALTRLCIDHGVPVLCEKAMFMSGAEAEEILAHAREKGVFAMEAMWSRFLPAVQEMKRRLDAGTAGEIHYAEFAIGWKAPDGPGNRFFDPAAGGGAAYDLLVYCYELAEYFFGVPEKVENVAVHWAQTGVDETETVTLRYPWGLAALSASIAVRLDERAVIHGRQAILHMPQPHFGASFTIRREEGDAQHWQDTETVNGFVYEVQEVMRCVRAGLLESPTVPHDLTIRCARLFDEINAAK